MRDKIKSILDDLRLRGMASFVDECLDNAQQNGTSAANVVLQLLEAEHRDNQERSLASRIKNAKLPWDWTIDTFPFDKKPEINKPQILALENLTFIERSENLIFIGKPGAGKSGIAMGLLRTALINGYRGKFYNAQDLLNELYASLADRTTSRLLKTICNYDAIVIDELGYLTLTPEQINIFFKLIDMRYKKKSTIITTNLEFEAWYDVFKHKELVDAMLDRIKHHCTVIKIEGPSLRDPQSSCDITQPRSKQKKSKSGESNDH